MRLIQLQKVEKALQLFDRKSAHRLFVICVREESRLRIKIRRH